MRNPSQPIHLHSFEVLPPTIQDVLYLPLSYSTSKPRINWGSLDSIEQVPKLVEPHLPERARVVSRPPRCKVSSPDDTLLGFASDQAHILLGRLADQLIGGTSGGLDSDFAFGFSSDRNSYGAVRWNSSKAHYEVAIHPYALVVCASIHSFAALLAHEIGHTMVARGTVHPEGDRIVEGLFYELQAYYSRAEELDLSLLPNVLSPEEIRHLQVPYLVKEEKRQELSEKTKILKEGLLLLSRQNEHTADLTACNLLYAAGFNPRGVIELHKQIRPSQEPSPTTHPPFHERISRAEKHVSSLPKVTDQSKNAWRYLEQDYSLLQLQVVPIISRQLNST